MVSFLGHGGSSLISNADLFPWFIVGPGMEEGFQFVIGDGEDKSGSNPSIRFRGPMMSKLSLSVGRGESGGGCLKGWLGWLLKNLGEGGDTCS